ncbi:hypothetical protein C7M84_006959 [Penaeus vannamei]|uniref:Uncharacterized protein n=1 Tax=Penaeus vannamei TaxID=6689 RepID=A0A3R7P3M6_PENVA|nr:hypothetical protein C7M84_006959 [Penaeus vannamei]
MAAYTTLPVALQGHKRAFNTLNSPWLSAAPSQTHHNFPSAITVPAAPSPSEFYHHHCRQYLSVPIAFAPPPSPTIPAAHLSRNINFISPFPAGGRALRRIGVCDLPAALNLLVSREGKNACCSAATQDSCCRRVLVTRSSPPSPPLSLPVSPYFSLCFLSGLRSDTRPLMIVSSLLPLHSLLPTPRYLPFFFTLSPLRSIPVLISLPPHSIFPVCLPSSSTLPSRLSPSPFPSLFSPVCLPSSPSPPVCSSLLLTLSPHPSSPSDLPFLLTSSLLSVLSPFLLPLSPPSSSPFLLHLSLPIFLRSASLPLHFSPHFFLPVASFLFTLSPQLLSPPRIRRKNTGGEREKKQLKLDERSPERKQSPRGVAASPLHSTLFHTTFTRQRRAAMAPKGRPLDVLTIAPSNDRCPAPAATSPAEATLVSTPTPHPPPRLSALATNTSSVSPSPRRPYLALPTSSSFSTPRTTAFRLVATNELRRPPEKPNKSRPEKHTGQKVAAAQAVTRSPEYTAASDAPDR